MDSHVALDIPTTRLGFVFPSGGLQAEDEVILEAHHIEHPHREFLATEIFLTLGWLINVKASLATINHSNSNLGFFLTGFGISTFSALSGASGHHRNKISSSRAGLGLGRSAL